VEKNSKIYPINGLNPSAIALVEADFGTWATGNNSN